MTHVVDVSRPKWYIELWREGSYGLFSPTPARRDGFGVPYPIFVAKTRDQLESQRVLLNKECVPS